MWVIIIEKRFLSSKFAIYWRRVFPGCSKMIPPLSPSARKVFYLKYIGNIFLYPNVIVDLYKHISKFVE